MVKMDKGYLPPAILSLIWAYAGGRSSWGFMLNNVNPYECPWLHWLHVGLSITTHHVISLNPLWVIPAHSFAFIEVSCLLLWGDPCISILSLLFSFPWKSIHPNKPMWNSKQFQDGYNHLMVMRKMRGVVVGVFSICDFVVIEGGSEAWSASLFSAFNPPHPPVVVLRGWI